MHAPLEQFVSWKILLISRTGVSFFNYVGLDKYSIIITLLLLASCLFFYYNTRYLFKLKMLQMSLYNWLQTEFSNVAGFSLTLFIPIFVSIFVYIYAFNLLGLLPYTACWTTQFFGNLTISFIVIVGITILNIDKNGFRFFELFIPSGVPQILIPMLFGLEFLSYWIRILSLSIRLFSNMVAGHSLLHILFDMSLSVRTVLENSLEVLLFVFAFALIIVYIIVMFELVVAFLQAYVFVVMISIYLNDLKLSH